MVFSIWRFSHLTLAISSFVFILIASVTGIILAIEPISEQLKPYSAEGLENTSLASTIAILENEYNEVISIEKDYNDFKVLYFQHLNNINAENFYYFNEIYFKKLFDLINKFGFIVTVKNKSKELLGASVFLGFKKNLHSHLTAISKTNKFSGINNVLLYNAYLYGKNNNFINCNLGGGISCNQDDSLLEFKRSMSNSKSNFYIGYKIYNEKIYSNLVNSYKKRYPAKFKINSKHILCYRSND